jgi:endonuclease/exonuclease/phosphatase family metal-dependent hydrolase
MTQNLYVGAEALPILTAPDPAAAAAQAFAQVLANNFPLRAAAIASEVQAAGGPLLIELQEASIITGGSIPLDYAQILVDQLAAVGLNYTIAGTHKASSVSLGGFSVTDQEIVLARTGVPGFAVTGSENHLFANNLELPTVLGLISADRGYVLVDATLDGVPFQFVTTHLESGELGEPFRPLQVAELLADLSASSLPQILVGDFNADPAELAYQAILAAGFGDTAAAVGAVGPTCCQASNLSNTVSELDTRLDYIFERGFSAILSAFLVGDTRFQSVPPLWPSDHAGVVATVVAVAVNVPEPSSAGILIVSMLLLSPLVGFGARKRDL